MAVRLIGARDSPASAENTWKIGVAAMAMSKTAEAITFAWGGMPRSAAT
jgi:hypothetical protein